MTVYFVSANYKQAAKADLPGVINAYFSITFDKDRYFSQSSLVTVLHLPNTHLYTTATLIDGFFPSHPCSCTLSFTPDSSHISGSLVMVSFTKSSSPNKHETSSSP